MNNSTQLADYVTQRFFVKQFFGDSLTISAIIPLKVTSMKPKTYYR